MPSTGGIVSKQELESYGGASVMLMSNGAEPIQTGSASGTYYYTWYLAWNSNGFSGGGWMPYDEDIVEKLENMTEIEKANMVVELIRNGYGETCANLSFS